MCEATSLYVANTILQQLGGGRFKLMTGAKQFMGDARSLSFKLPSRFATGGINYVKVVLTPADTYTMIFGKTRGTSFRILAVVEGVYDDMLRAIFTQQTGLDCTM